MSEPKRVFKNIFISIALVLSIAGLGLSLFSDVLIRLMADKAFWSAGGVVPIIVISVIVLALTNFNNFGILLKKKTGIIAVGTYINAFVITIGFVFFIPLFGLYGAASAIFLGGLFQLIWIEWSSNKLYDMQLPWSRVALMNITWMMCYAFSLLLPEALLISVAGKSLIFISFIWLMFVLPILEKEEKKKIFTYTKAIIVKASNYFYLKKA